jgi:hypothetical protein
VPEEKEKEGWRVYPMVMSIGFNPFYKNTIRSAEVHVMKGFEKDFYGSEMRIAIVGFIRPEYNYESLEKLIGWCPFIYPFCCGLLRWVVSCLVEVEGERWAGEGE